MVHATFWVIIRFVFSAIQKSKTTSIRHLPYGCLLESKMNIPAIYSQSVSWMSPCKCSLWRLSIVDLSFTQSAVSVFDYCNCLRLQVILLFMHRNATSWQPKTNPTLDVDCPCSRAWHCENKHGIASITSILYPCVLYAYLILSTHQRILGGGDYRFQVLTEQCQLSTWARKQTHPGAPSCLTIPVSYAFQH